MQEAAGTAVKVAVGEAEEKEAVRCPRCDSANTKFCYYNNYNLSQPRHFCKDCRRYWTKGGSLRNVPVGGGTRKNCKRAAAAVGGGSGGSTPKRRLSSEPPNTTSSVPIVTSKPEPIPFFYQGVDCEDRILDVGESFSSLLASGETFRSMLDTFQTCGQGGGFGGFPVVAGESIRTTVAAPAAELQSSNDSGGSSENPATLQLENLMGLQGDSSPWAGEWPDHAIYTPGSGFR